MAMRMSIFLKPTCLNPADYNQLIKVSEKASLVQSFREAMDWFLAEVKRGMSIQRYKVLGEMNPDQLWETLMDPKVRRMMKGQIEDTISSDRIFTMLMGERLKPEEISQEATPWACGTWVFEASVVRKWQTFSLPRLVPIQFRALARRY
jgi:hypothetical protein